MTEAILYIKCWGDSLGIRIPATIFRAASLRANQKVRISVEGGRVIIEPERKGYLTLRERLDAYDISRHGGEAMAVD